MSININIHQSKFNKFHLKQLNDKSTSYRSPLSTIAHIDVNCFFAQVEQIRLGLSSQDPIVCVQWSSLIAVNYAARSYNINRLDTLQSAMLKCPILKPIHTAVFKKGETFWRYYNDDPFNHTKFPSPINHKVSLDPYRRESRKLLNLINQHCDLVEKASVDECFLDLGRLVIRKLLEYQPDFIDLIDNLQDNDSLPDLIINSIPIHGELIFPNETITDYDDLFIILGSILSKDIRKHISNELGYTTSCGIARVKTIAKLASSFKKPNNQTIIPSSQIKNFLIDNNFAINDFWSMGGKTGDFINTKLEHKLVSHLLPLELSDYNKLNDPKLSLKIYQLIRGEFKQSLTETIILKSMMSNKNIRGNSGICFKDCEEWVKIFAIDLKQRLIELNDENGNVVLKPKTITVHFKCFKNWKFSHSKQCNLSNYNDMEEFEMKIYTMGLKLLKELEEQFKDLFYPLANLNLTISNFETLHNDQGSILKFIKKREIVPDNNNILEVNTPKDINDKINEIKDEKIKRNDNILDQIQSKSKDISNEINDSVSIDEINDKGSKDHYQFDNDVIKCLKCDLIIDDLIEHKDYHYALDLTNELNGSISITPSITTTSINTKKKQTKFVKNGNKRKKIDKSQVDKNQSKLPF